MEGVWGGGGYSTPLALNIIVNPNYNNNDVKLTDTEFSRNVHIKCEVYKKLKNSFKPPGVRIGIKSHLLVVMFIDNS